MIIHGLQKMSLLDFPGKMACTVFTGGCNFRCPFCHNALLVLDPDHAEQISEDDFFSFLSKRSGWLDGVAITGGEPMMQKDLPEFISRIKSLGFQVKLDTNGSYPDRLIDVVSRGLVDYVAVDIKNIPSAYGSTVGIPSFNFSPVEKSINFLKENRVPYELRTTVVRELHSRDQLVELARFIGDIPHYFLQSFVDSGNTISGNLSAYSSEELSAILEDVRRYVPHAEIRGIEE